MLVYNSKIIGTPVLSVQESGPLGQISAAIVDPDNLKVIAFRLVGPGVEPNRNLLAIQSIREYSTFGVIIDSEDELIAPSDVIKIEKVLSLNFNLLNLKVETKKGTKLGQITDFTIDSDSFIVQQIIVKRPLVKRFIDPELTISRKEIVEVTDYKIIIKDEEKTLKERASREDFIPNFVNPFRTEPAHSPADTENPADTDIE